MTTTIHADSIKTTADISFVISHTFAPYVDNVRGWYDTLHVHLPLFGNISNEVDDSFIASETVKPKSVISQCGAIFARNNDDGSTSCTAHMYVCSVCAWVDVGMCVGVLRGAMSIVHYLSKFSVVLVVEWVWRRI